MPLDSIGHRDMSDSDPAAWSDVPSPLYLGAVLAHKAATVPAADSRNPPRTICDVARDIQSAWKKISPHAKPYLDAMHFLSGPSDMYGADDAKGIVLYFLSNASGWRGEDAKRLKADLKLICGIK